VLHQLLDAIGNERALSVSDVTSLLKLTELILCNKTEHLDINCRAKNGKVRAERYDVAWWQAHGLQTNAALTFCTGCVVFGRE
jgi:hypothetical protein